MKTIFAISLSFLIFSQSVGLSASDVFMLKDLVEHAQYHHEKFGDDFTTFFKKHYGSEKTEHQKKHKEEKSQHEKLPFQHNNANHIVVDVIVAGYGFPLEKSVIPYIGNSHFYYQNLYSFLERASIFQPPKIA